MKIAYITMKWPMRSETFAARDVNALSEQGHDVVIVSGDKDLLQLVSDKVVMWDTMKDKVMDPQWLKKSTVSP